MKNKTKKKEELRLKWRQRYYRKKWKNTPFGNTDLWLTYFKQVIDLITEPEDKFNVVMRVTRKGEVEIVLKLNPQYKYPNYPLLK